MHFWQNIQWLLPQTDINHTIFIQYICTSHHNILKLRVLAHVTSNEIVYSKCIFFNSLQFHCMLGWTGDIGAKKVWEIPRQPKNGKKMLAVQFIQRCPTFVSILGKLNCKSYRSSSSGNSSKYQEKENDAAEIGRLYKKEYFRNYS